ncbi:MAG: G-D-S-L family lipolytic protein [Planctomycetes bacterium]|nr:G-D-S-L family lipolytic protein [Planctomycetota bacterium]
MAQTINILPLGDSITQGGKNNRAEYTYRHPLFCMLKDDAVDFDYVGSMTKGLHGDAKWPDYKGQAFDLDHEGHYGWKTKAVQEKLVGWSKKWAAAPDIVLIHLGTNDQKSPDLQADVIAPMKIMVEFFRSQNPRVVVLIAQLNFNGGTAVTLRPMYDALCAELNTDESPVASVHGYKGWNENPKHQETHTFDWAHPNPHGQKKMAEDFYAAMKPYLKHAQK